MKHYLVFYAGLLYDEYDRVPWASQMPEGSYLYDSGTGHWFVLIPGGWTPINLCDVPPELRTYLLLIT